jgi:hypothetical protein
VLLEHPLQNQAVKTKQQRKMHHLVHAFYVQLAQAHRWRLHLQSLLLQTAQQQQQQRG